METPASFSDFVAALHTTEPDPQLVAPYLATHGNPIIEGSTAHFLAAARLDKVIAIRGDWNGWDVRRGLMQPLGGGLLHYQHDFAPDARVDYQFVLIDEAEPNRLNDPTAIASWTLPMLLDPLDPNSDAGAGENLELAMPDYQRPAITQRRSNQYRGMLVEGDMYSAALGQMRRYIVYAPQGYNLDGPPFPAIYFHDGGDYLNYAGAATILDNLIADRTIPPLVAVFAPPLHRWAEYDCNDAYLTFFADELVAEAQREFNLIDDAAGRAIMGPSMGGLISLYIASKRPDVFSMVAAQSSVTRAKQGSWAAHQAYGVEPPLPLKLHLVVGTYENCYGIDEQGNCKDILTGVRELRDVLTQRGYPLQYSEHHQGHSWGLWRDDLADALGYFFGQGLASGWDSG